MKIAIYYGQWSYDFNGSEGRAIYLHSLGNFNDHRLIQSAFPHAQLFLDGELIEECDTSGIKLNPGDAVEFGPIDFVRCAVWRALMRAGQMPANAHSLLQPQKVPRDAADNYTYDNFIYAAHYYEWHIENPVSVRPHMTPC